MVTPRYTVPCLRNDLIAHEIYDFRLEKPEGFDFKPGQFILFDVPLLENPTDIQTRAFSVASSPEETELVFVAKLIAGGRASRWIAEAIHAGTPITFQGPFGRFTLPEKSDKDYLFICTSTGIAPFRSQLLHALRAGDTRRMDLIFGAHAEQDVFWVEEFEALAKQYENFSFHMTLTHPSDSWKGPRGRVQTLVPQIAEDLSTKHVYVCGNPDMTNEVKNLCLEEWGIERSNLHVEGYI